MKFNPCTGLCTEDGTHCEGCGRSHEEIAQLRAHVKSLVEFARKMDYENIEEYTESIAKNVKYKLQNP